MKKALKVVFSMLVVAFLFAGCAAPTAAPTQAAATTEAAATEAAAATVDAQAVCAADEFGCAVFKPGEVVKIGMGAPMTGGYSSFGIDISQGATIAIEDASFYTNPGGINLRGLFRAAWNNLRGLSVQGASSIASQLVRNVIMTPEERFQISYTRKINEAVMAIELSRRYPGVEGKDKILEWYLNAIFYGRLANGVEAAAEAYFGKHASELDLAEAALLAQLPQYPALDPVVYADEAKKRQARRLAERK